MPSRCCQIDDIDANNDGRTSSSLRELDSLAIWPDTVTSVIEKIYIVDVETKLALCLPIMIRTLPFYWLTSEILGRFCLGCLVRRIDYDEWKGIMTRYLEVSGFDALRKDWA